VKKGDVLKVLGRHKMLTSALDKEGNSKGGSQGAWVFSIPH